jgi:cyclin-dependent kinase-like
VRKTALREIRILKQLKHDHIVNLIEVFRESGKIFLVFEQLNRTILEELEGQNDNMGIDPLEVIFRL